MFVKALACIGRGFGCVDRFWLFKHETVELYDSV